MKHQSVEKAKTFLAAHVPAALLEKYFGWFPEVYFEEATLELIEEQFKLLGAFQETLNHQLSVKNLTQNQFQISLTCADFMSLFSMVAGLFSSHGFNIIRGTVWTIQDPKRLSKASRALISLQLEASETPRWQELEKDLGEFLQKAQEGRMEDIRKELNVRIVRFFRTHQESYLDKLYPIQLEIDQTLSDSETVVSLRTQDTMAFLYELTSALAALEINIVRMEIETNRQMVEDRIWLTTEAGAKITSARKLKELRWAILLIKQFTHLLPKVPDPVVALDQMVSFGKEIFGRDDFEQILLTLEEGDVLGHLSKIFGTSRFLWEEFIRTQHQSLIPLLENQEVLQNRKSRSQMERELIKKLRSVREFPEKIEMLNSFKDQEMFRIDSRHLLRKTSYVEEFAEEFSDLCEVVVGVGYHLAWDEVSKTLPQPTVSGKMKSDVALLALGKFGGRELGYASDLELLFVYTDDKDTSSEQSQKNLEFYSELVRKFRSVIWSRHEGVFEIDLRLRPHGENGPLAASLELFKNYYSAKGEAWSYERQALVKLRAIAGSPWLGKEIERLRDEFVYGEAPFRFEEVIRLRERQRQELVAPAVFNAKYSEGGLLDIEYLVQTLQIAFGRTRPFLRNTNTLNAMRTIWQEGILSENEFQVLRASYLFILNLINALRIFRGNAKDLTLPKKEDLEFVILGRRLGYEGSDETIQTKLEEACSHHVEVAARFYRDWMNKLSRLKWEEVSRIKVHTPKVLKANLDELLRGELSEASEKSLRDIGFTEIGQAAQSMKRMYPGALSFEAFAKTFDQMWSIWPKVPDADLALKHLERLAESVKDPSYFWQSLIQAKEGLPTLLALFGSSNYLSELVITHPDYWQWILEQKNLTLRTTQESLESLRCQPRREKEIDEEIVEDLRRLRHRETLRIAICEMKGIEIIDSVLRTFSELANYILGEVFFSPSLNDQFCVVALGKLGGEELNFSSDVDLIFVSEDLETLQSEKLVQHLQKSVRHLSHSSSEGFLYRVDLRLRPHGVAGSLAMSCDDSLRYYEKEADLWECQALLKARPVSGDRSLGEKLIFRLDPFVYGRDWSGANFDRLREVKRRYEAQTRSQGEEYSNIKMGLGGIRDIEFSVQALQLRHGKTIPQLKGQNTISVFQAIEQAKLLPEKECEALKEGYLFLRRIENKIHLHDNRQTFLIPDKKQDLRRLARSLGFSDSKDLKAENQFEQMVRGTMSKCRAIFERIFFE